MIKSMTAFAREESKQEFGTLSWELRSVNHRYLEPFVRLPEDFRSLETDVRDLLKQYVHRGKVECILALNQDDSQVRELSLNDATVSLLATLCDRVREKIPTLREVSPLEILKWPGVLAKAEADMELMGRSALSLLEQGLKDFVAARQREGDKLKLALEEKLEVMSEIVTQVRARVPEILQQVRQRLSDRFAELNLQLDNDRLEQEMVLITQKSDVEEELKRLETHINEVQRILKSKDDKPVGRRLDFLMQELNREANTLCSKSMDADTTKAGIDLKVFIEQMREQVQNIE